jgi:hypothetical protein
MSTIAMMFTPDPRYDGVRPIQIFLLRVSYVLVLVFVGIRAVAALITHEGDWEPFLAVALSMWASSSQLSLIGIVHPLKMIPIVLFEIGYKLTWLAVVAWPLWKAGRLAGSPAEGMTYAFLPVAAPLLLMPWGYVFRTYGWRR